MRLRNTIVFIVVLALASGLYAQREGASIHVRKIESKQIIDGAQLFYSLPKNIIRIELTAKKTVQQPGPLSKYASKYLNITEGYITNESEFHEIVDVKFNVYSVPDSNQFFVINARDIFTLPELQLNEDGVIKGVNVADEIQGYSTETCRLVKPMDEDEEYYFDDFGIKEFLKENTQTFYRTVQTDSTPKRVPYEKTTLEPLSDEEIADAIAALLRKMKKRKMKLLFNQQDEVNRNEGEALKASIKELNELEDYYISLFMGKTFTREYKVYFDYNPDENAPVEQEVLTYYSPSLGFTDSKPDLRRNDYKPVTIKSNLLGSKINPDIKVMDNSEKTPFVINYGLYYRVPGRIDMTVRYNSETLARKQVQVAQKGVVLPMPVDYLNYKYGVEYYPETGALKKITKPLEPIQLGE